MGNQNVDQINGVSLCSGGGGIDIALKLVVPSIRTICWVEWEAFAQSVLVQRMEEKILDAAPLWSNIKSFDGKPWRGIVDFLTAGYPCQPFSFCGKRRGSEDSRHLWPHICRIIGECQPTVCFFENVKGHLSLGFQEVAEELRSMGYSVAAGLFSADEVGCSFQGERLFILAVAKTHTPRFSGWVEFEKKCEKISFGTRGSTLGGGFPPYPNSEEWGKVPEYRFPAIPNVCFGVDGVANRNEWIVLLGNGVVPLQAAYAFSSLWCALRVS